jgi:hypothetical protein
MIIKSDPWYVTLYLRNPTAYLYAVSYSDKSFFYCRH